MLSEKKEIRKGDKMEGCKYCQWKECPLLNRKECPINLLVERIEKLDTITSELDTYTATIENISFN